MTSLHFIRHGSTQANEEDKIRGWSDIPLDEKGIEGAKETAKELKNSGIKVLVHSDLQRAKDTAQAISDTTKAEMVPNWKLRAWDVGSYTGKPSKTYNDEICNLIEKEPDKKPPGNGESYNQFKGRYLAGVKEAIETAGDQKLGIVSHHTGERLLKGWTAKGQPASHEVDPKVVIAEGDKPAGAEKINIKEENLYGSNMGR
jgi:2,3-bisphosphoglycerate-dependent phosphoglycerate mutase